MPAGAVERLEALNERVDNLPTSPIPVLASIASGIATGIADEQLTMTLTLNQTTGAANAALPSGPVATLTRTSGSVEGILVEFTLDSGDGKFPDGSKKYRTATNNSGIAQASGWILGTTGTKTMTATVPAAGKRVAVSATITATAT